MVLTPSKSGTTADGTCYRLYGGTDNVLVFIHGLGLNQDMWNWQLKAVGVHRCVLTYDLTGHGNSGAPDQTPSLTMFAKQLASLLDELGIDEAIVAGFSLGGMIARRFAMDFPKHTKALAILNSAHKRDREAHDAIQKRVLQAKEEGPSATVEAALSRWFTDDFRNNNPDVMAFVRDTILSNDRQIYPLNYQVLVDGVDELVGPSPAIDCPTLVMTAEEDYGNSPEMSRAISQEISGSQLVILPNLRHMAMVERPDLFNQKLLEFLSDIDQDGKE